MDSDFTREERIAVQMQGNVVRVEVYRGEEGTEEINEEKPDTHCSAYKCYLEFSGQKVENIKGLQEIVGRHVYNKTMQNNGQEFVKLVIE